MRQEMTADRIALNYDRASVSEVLKMHEVETPCPKRATFDRLEQLRSIYRSKARRASN